MAVQIHIPSALRSFTERQAVVEVDAADVSGALRALTDAHPALSRHLRDDSGKLRSFINVYLGEDDIRHLPAGEATALRGGEVLMIVPSIAGGAA